VDRLICFNHFLRGCYKHSLLVLFFGETTLLMPSKKTSKPEIETVKAAEPAVPAKKKTTQSKTTTPAATHKAPATKQSAPRKSAVKAEPAPAPAVEVVTASVVTFDAAQHHEEISREAYFVYLSRGAGHGNEHEDWLKAIEIVRARHAK
jgi:hypothetical protein